MFYAGNDAGGLKSRVTQCVILCLFATIVVIFDTMDELSGPSGSRRFMAEHFLETTRISSRHYRNWQNSKVPASSFVT
jgi:hypothetical protein